MRYEAKRLYRPAHFLIFVLNEMISTPTLCFFFLQLVIPLTTQDDLDKAVELLDRSVHMKSLKILLVLQMSSQVSSSQIRFTHVCH